MRDNSTATTISRAPREKKSARKSSCSHFFYYVQLCLCFSRKNKVVNKYTCFLDSHFLLFNMYTVLHCSELCVCEWSACGDEMLRCVLLPSHMNIVCCAHVMIGTGTKKKLTQNCSHTACDQLNKL